MATKRKEGEGEGSESELLLGRINQLKTEVHAVYLLSFYTTVNYSTRNFRNAY